MPSVLTPLDPSRIPTLISLRSAFCHHEKITFDEKLTLNALNDLLSNASLGGVWLIHFDDAIAGYLVLTYGFSLEFDGRDAFIDELFVDEGYRGKGLGKLAVNFADEICRDRGIRALHIEVDHHNDRAHEMYRKAGFADRGNHLLTKRLGPVSKVDI